MAASTTILLIEQLEASRVLSRAEAEAVMEELLCGRMDNAEIVRFLRALNQRPILVASASGSHNVPICHALKPKMILIKSVSPSPLTHARHTLTSFYNHA